MNEVAAGAAVLFDPDNPGSFDRALLELAPDAGLRRRLGEAGMAAAAKYSWKRCANRFEDILQRTWEESR